MEMLSLPVHNLFMELHAMTSNREAFRSIGFQNGFFSPIKKRGIASHYFILPRALDSKRVYAGKDSHEMRQLIQAFHEGKDESEAFRVEIRKISKMLKASDVMCLDRDTFRVIDSFNDGGLFRLGGVLIGTHAFTVIGNNLGKKWQNPALRTQDVDFAKGSVKFASSQTTETQEKLSIPDRINMLKMGLTPVPALNWNGHSTSFSNKRGFRVDFLVPLVGKPKDSTVFIKDFNVAATPMRFLDYLIEETFETTAVSSSGSVTVTVPHPERFAFHKLIVAANRPKHEAPKVRKDIHQAWQLFEILLEREPDDLYEAREALTDSTKERGEGWLKHVRKGLRYMDHQNKAMADQLRKSFF